MGFDHELLSEPVTYRTSEACVIEGPTTLSMGEAMMPGSYPPLNSFE